MKKKKKKERNKEQNNNGIAVNFSINQFVMNLN